MGITTIMKKEVQDILIAVRLAGDAVASAGAPYDSQAFLQGYHAALDAVAAAMGFDPSSASTGFASNAHRSRASNDSSRGRDWPSRYDR